MGYYLFHSGSADHSSEDRIRGICQILTCRPEICCGAMEEDWHYGLAQVGDLRRHRTGLRRGDWCITDRPGDICGLSRGVQGLLWGWEPTAKPDREQAKLLRRFRGILVSQQRSVELLHRAGVKKNVCIGPDPSVLVRRQLRGLEGAFRRDTVGLCISPATARRERTEGLLFRSYCHLIRWILTNTDWEIALIPYCVKGRCNDLLLQKAVKNRFPRENRLICRSDTDCQGLRGDLSLCRCCVGGAAVGAAWSCGVPGLCVGPSGGLTALADHLFGTHYETVAGTAELGSEADLTDRFVKFLDREAVLRRWLEVSAPRYRKWAGEWKWCG